MSIETGQYNHIYTARQTYAPTVTALSSSFLSSTVVKFPNEKQPFLTTGVS